MIRCYYNSRKVKAMNTKQVIPRGILYTETNDKFFITKEEPFSRLGWMTPSQQRWSVIPFNITKKDLSTGKWVYLPEQIIICSNPTIVYEELGQITVLYIKDNQDE